MLKLLLPACLLVGACVAATATDAGPVRKGAYKLVTRDGQALYCRTDKDTGSHVRSTTVCLTGKEMTELSERSQQGLRDLARTAPPKQGS